MSTGKYRKEHDCLNCGSQVEKHYCSNCGQPNLELKESFWAFISHSIAHYFHFDNKFFQTLVPLLTKPGKVTLDYLAGKRARYINPVSMYIFVSIVYFLVVYSPKHGQKDAHESVKVRKAKGENVRDSVNKALKLSGVPSNVVVKKTVKSIDQAIKIKDFKKLSFADQEIELNKLKAENATVKSDSLSDLIEDYNDIHIERNDSTYSAYLVRQNNLPLIEQDDWYDRLIKKRAIAIGEKSEVIQETLEHNRPKQYFLLMPLLALLIMWNFSKNHIYYLNHLIFTIHGMTAYFIVQIFTEPLIKHVFGEHTVITNVIELAVVIWICWYMFNALKVFYQRRSGSIIFKMFWIIVMYWIAFNISEVVMVNLIYYVAT